MPNNEERAEHVWPKLLGGISAVPLGIAQSLLPFCTDGGFSLALLCCELQDGFALLGGFKMTLSRPLPAQSRCFREKYLISFPKLISLAGSTCCFKRRGEEKRRGYSQWLVGRLGRA